MFVPAGNYIPALKYRILTPLYDTFLGMGMKENLLKSRLVTQVNPKDNERILDFGCGTGTLTLMIKKAKPGCIVYGIDIDPQVLEIAEKKAEREGVDVHLMKYDGITLPCGNESLDKVVASLVIHHLSKEEKFRIFGEMYRVLKNGGELHIMDFGIQRSLYAKLITSVTRFLEPIEENILGKIPGYLVGSGFKSVEEVYSENTLFGTVSFYQSRKLS